MTIASGVRSPVLTRVLVVWCPDWPVDAAFETVIETIEQLMPGVQPLSSGLCAIRARGPTRYYGGEENAARAVLDCLGALGIPAARIGIADGIFAAEQAARLLTTSESDSGTAARIGIVAPTGTAAFLIPLPITVLDDLSLVTLLFRLGVRTLGAFAALPLSDVHARFGAAGAHAHALASGLDERQVAVRIPPRNRDLAVDFEPPLDSIEHVASGFRATAEHLIADLTAEKLVTTAIRIEIRGDRGEKTDRTWLHPRWFTATEVLDRVRWQLRGGDSIGSGLVSGISRVAVSPVTVDAMSNHEEGLWGGGRDEQVHHGLARVQSMLGYEAVLTAVIGGGRMLAERGILVPWGETLPGVGKELEVARARPWPGQLPPPLPSTVFRSPFAVTVLDTGGSSVRLDDRGAFNSEPARFASTTVTDEARTITAWSGPWPVNEHWWDVARVRNINRIQLVDGDGTAWLLVLNGDRWWAEARYD